MTYNPREIVVPRLSEEDRLFVSHDDNRWATACLNFGNEEHGYINGYRQIADLAVEHVAATDRDQDYLVFPIVFGYRQYLELRTKDLLMRAAELLDRARPDSKVMTRHELTPIWVALVPFLREIFGRDPQIELIGTRIIEFDTLDQGSFAFRYPTTKAGALALPTDLRWVSLTNIRSTVEKMASSLDGWDMGLNYYLDQKAEELAFLAEQGREYQGSCEDEYAQYVADTAPVTAGIS